jgi:uncharacterized protein (TIRG00374 family)
VGYLRVKNLRRISSSPLARLCLGIAVSGVFLFLFFRGLNLADMRDIFSGVYYSRVVWVLLALAAHILAKAIRWKLIIGSFRKISFGTSFSNILIGLMANNLLPARTGELVRVMSLSKLSNISPASVLSALLLERILDIYVLVIFFTVTVHSVELHSYLEIFSVIKRTAVIILVVYTVGLALILLLMRFGMVDRLKLLMAARFPFLVAKVDEFYSGLESVRSPSKFLIVFLWSFVIWGINAIVVLAMAGMFQNLMPDIYSYLGPVEGIFLNSAATIGMLIPAAPGNFGTYHWLCAVVLESLGIPETLGKSYAVLNHGIQYILFTVAGILFFWKYHFSFKSILKPESAYKEGSKT